MSLSHRQIPCRKSQKQIPHNYITMGFLKWGYPKSWMVHNFIMGQQKTLACIEIDDLGQLGVTIFGKPPYSTKPPYTLW